jgi:uncharacterized protein (TIGR03437 family)
MNKTIHNKLLVASRACLVLALSCTAVLADSSSRVPARSFGPTFRRSQPLAALASPAVVTAAATAPTNLLTPRAMKLLVLASDGTEPGLAALTSFLDQIGIPYDKVLTASQPLPPLTGATGNGSYQGIILTTGNLAYNNGTTFVSGLDTNGWATLDAYTYNFGVRTVSYDTFPEARYGLSFVTALSTDTAPASIAFTADAASYFPYLNQKNPVTVSNAFVYLASPVAAAEETTTPLLTYNGSTVAVYHKDASGREYLALTFDNNPYLTHSMALNYGLFNWVTRGLFLGARKIYFSPQFDDFFIADIKYNPSTCPQGAFQTDPTASDPPGCTQVRLTGADLTDVANWQNTLNQDLQTQQVKISFPFNGIGTTATDNGGDNTLENGARHYGDTFFWLSHTWDHENLDCYNATPGQPCVPATLTESAAEITQNNALANFLKLNYDPQSMVTPNVSGLENPAFLQAAVANNLQYLVCDASACDPEVVANSYLPALPPNTGVVNAHEPSILEIPRHATNIFYNATDALTNVNGSETDEYNFFYSTQLGPQTYQQILDREAGYILGYMLRYDAAPLMFHQSNLYWYVSGQKSLFTDLAAAVISQFKSLSTLPVISLSQSGIGQLMRDRAAYNASGVTGVLTPEIGFTLTTTGAAKIPVTGICQDGSCESYGGQNISTFNMAAGGTATVTFATSGLGTALSVADASGPFNGTVNLSATLTTGNNHLPLSGRTVTLYLNGVAAGTPQQTNNSGVVSVTNVSLTGIPAGNYPQYISASFAGDGTYAATGNSATLVVSQLPTSISWSNPADLAYGTPLGAAQLNATASVPGIFVYTPAAGTVLDAGNGQPLSVTFTPTDQVNYNTVTATVHINIAPPPTIFAGGAVNAASFIPGPVAPGSLVAIFGANLAISTASATSFPLPTSLGNTSVRLNGVLMPLLYVSSTQVNAQIPFETSTGTMSIVATANGITSLPVTVQVSSTGPGIFLLQETHAAATNLDGSINSSLNPAKAGSYVTVYFTGQGALDNPGSDGAPAPLKPLSRTLASTSATIGGVDTLVSFSGATPTLAGLSQVNLVVPNGIAPGEYSVSITVGGVTSNSGTVSVTDK